MKLKAIIVNIIVILLFPIQDAYCQFLNYEKYEFKIENLIVYSKDTCIKVNKCIGQNGEIGFERGFADISKFESTLTYVTDPKIQNGIGKYWKSEFIILRDIDTITDFFYCDKGLPLYKDTTIEGNKKYITLYCNDTFLTSVKFSFIINWLVENTTFSYSNNSIIYLFPDPLTKLEKYWIYKFESNKKGSINLFLYIIFSNNLSGYHLTSTDSTIISERKLKMFNKRLGDVKKLEKSDYCDLDGEKSGLLAVNNKRFIYSWYCSILKDKKMKEVRRFIKEFNELVYYSSLRKTIENSNRDTKTKANL